MKSFRQKGQHAEYEVRDLLQVLVDKAQSEFVEENPLNSLVSPIVLVRNLEQRRSGGSDIVGLQPDWAAIEVKRQENVSVINSWWLQTITAAAMKGMSSGEILKTDSGEWIYEKEPILIWRQNNCPWKVRMFGWLDLNSNIGWSERNDGRIRATVDIPDWDVFAEWFVKKVKYMLVRAYVVSR